jgi:hypothetical protein
LNAARPTLMSHKLKQKPQYLDHLAVAGIRELPFQQSIDTTTPAGRLMFQVTGAFAENHNGRFPVSLLVGHTTIDCFLQ